MSYKDFYFRFPDRQTAQSSLAALVGANVDHVGAIPGGPAGWHVNVRLQDGQAVPAAMKPYRIDAPLRPYRVWAAQEAGVA